jgi:hypothetical protein
MNPELLEYALQQLDAMGWDLLPMRYKKLIVEAAKEHLKQLNNNSPQGKACL